MLFKEREPLRKPGESGRTQQQQRTSGGNRQPNGMLRHAEDWADRTYATENDPVTHRCHRYCYCYCFYWLTISISTDTQSSSGIVRHRHKKLSLELLLLDVTITRTSSVTTTLTKTTTPANGTTNGDPCETSGKGGGEGADVTCLSRCCLRRRCWSVIYTLSMCRYIDEQGRQSCHQVEIKGLEGKPSSRTRALTSACYTIVSWAQVGLPARSRMVSSTGPVAPWSTEASDPFSYTTQPEQVF